MSKSTNYKNEKNINEFLKKNNLKEVRQKNGLTQEELGNYVGVSRQTIISIERYRYKPTLELAMKIAAKLNTKIEKLFFFE